MASTNGVNGSDDSSRIEELRQQQEEAAKRNGATDEEAAEVALNFVGEDAEGILDGDKVSFSKGKVKAEGEESEFDFSQFDFGDAEDPRAAIQEVLRVDPSNLPSWLRGIEPSELPSIMPDLPKGIEPSELPTELLPPRLRPGETPEIPSGEEVPPVEETPDVPAEEETPTTGPVSGSIDLDDFEIIAKQAHNSGNYDSAIAALENKFQETFGVTPKDSEGNYTSEFQDLINQTFQQNEQAIRNYYQYGGGKLPEGVSLDDPDFMDKLFENLSTEEQMQILTDMACDGLSTDDMLNVTYTPSTTETPSTETPEEPTSTISNAEVGEPVTIEDPKELEELGIPAEMVAEGNITATKNENGSITVQVTDPDTGEVKQSFSSYNGRTVRVDYENGKPVSFGEIKDGKYEPISINSRPGILDPGMTPTPRNIDPGMTPFDIDPGMTPRDIDPGMIIDPNNPGQPIEIPPRTDIPNLRLGGGFLINAETGEVYWLDFSSRKEYEL